MGLWTELEERLGKQLLSDALALGAKTQSPSNTEQPDQGLSSEQSRTQKQSRENTTPENRLDFALDDSIHF